MKDFSLSKRKFPFSSKKTTNSYLREIFKLRKTIPEWDNFFTEGSEETRGNNWVRLEVLGEPLCEKYAWAIPNQRALNIVANFSPLIEIGAGKGYWANELRQMGVDILCYDKHVDAELNWTTVEKGGPKKLRDAKAQGRTLFLCYPDDSQSLGMKCLSEFSGEYIIHVGELITTGTLSGSSQAPFGRTTGSDFSVALAENFHCLLVASLPRFPFSKDCITVWKRTVYVPGRSVLLGEDDSDGQEDQSASLEDGNSDGSGSAQDEDCWAAIPPEERLPVDAAAPCLAHLLKR